MTGMETKRVRGKCIANALVCQLCLTFLYTVQNKILLKLTHTYISVTK